MLISALIGTVSHGSNDWLIDSGASKHMTGFKESFVNLSEHVVEYEWNIPWIREVCNRDPKEI